MAHICIYNKDYWEISLKAAIYGFCYDYYWKGITGPNFTVISEYFIKNYFDLFFDKNNNENSIFDAFIQKLRDHNNDNKKLETFYDVIHHMSRDVEIEIENETTGKIILNSSFLNTTISNIETQTKVKILFLNVMLGFGFMKPMIYFLAMKRGTNNNGVSVDNNFKGNYKDPPILKLFIYNNIDQFNR